MCRFSVSSGSIAFDADVDFLLSVRLLLLVLVGLIAAIGSGCVALQ